MKHLKLSSMKLKNKIISIIAFCTLLVLIVSAILNLYIIRTYNNVLYGSISNSLSYSSNEILMKLNDIDKLTYSITENNQIQSSLSILKDTPIIYSNDYNQLYYTLQSYYSNSKENNVLNLSLFTDQITLHTNTSVSKQVPMEVYDSILTAANATNGKSGWVTEHCNEYGLFIAKKIRRIESLKLDNLGVLIFHVDINTLIQSSTSLNQFENFNYLLTNQHNDIIYNPNKLSIEEVNSLQNILCHTYGIVKVNGLSFFATSNTIDKYNWNYICLIPYDLVFQSIMKSIVISILFIIFCLILILFISKRLIKHLTRHFDDLIKQMDFFAKSDPTQVKIVFDYPPVDDEICLLYKHFDQMTQEISGLIRKNYANQLLMKDAQIKALEMQINPHFLYNTLETINWRAKSIGEIDISKMVESLAKLLRVTLDSNFALIPLSQELHLIQSYIYIQKTRFEERLDYQEEVPYSVHNALIPKLTLQPIVENSIRHALEKMIDVCHIKMTIKKQGDNLLIYIMNNGSSYEYNMLDRLREKQVNPSGNGIGLLNIDKRIKLTFGDQYGISLYNEIDMAVTLVTIPYHNGTN